jgi:hypothetical protein
MTPREPGDLLPHVFTAAMGAVLFVVGVFGVFGPIWVDVGATNARHLFRVAAHPGTYRREPQGSDCPSHRDGGGSHEPNDLVGDGVAKRITVSRTQSVFDERPHNGGHERRDIPRPRTR